MVITLFDLPFEDGYLDQITSLGSDSYAGWHTIDCPTWDGRVRPYAARRRSLAETTCDRCLSALLGDVLPGGAFSGPHGCRRILQPVWLSLIELSRPVPHDGDEAHRQLLSTHQATFDLTDACRFAHGSPDNLEVIAYLEGQLTKRIEQLSLALRSPAAVAQMWEQCKRFLDSGSSRSRGRTPPGDRFLFGYPALWVGDFGDSTPERKARVLAQRIVIARTIHQTDDGHRLVDTNGLEAAVLFHMIEAGHHYGTDSCHLDGADADVVSTATALWEPLGSTPFNRLEECVAVAQAVLA